MKKHIKTILSILIFIISVISLIKFSEVSATNLNGKGNSFTVDAFGGTGWKSDLLMGANHVFCIQEGQELNSGSTYTIKYYAKINGTKCEIYSGNKTKYLGVTDNEINAKFAYIVSQPDIEIGKTSAGEWNVEKVKKKLYDGNEYWVHKVNTKSEYARK